MKKNVLFICTHNSARSQMAEGLLRYLYGDRFEVYSAGTEPSFVRPQAIEVMKELGIDISAYRSKSVDEFSKKELDYIVTVCDNAGKTCPFLPGGKSYIHQSFNDPSALQGDADEILAGFRRIRDEIKVWIEDYFNDK